MRSSQKLADADLLRDMQILLHPQWGSSIYPASLFAKASLEEIKAAVEAAAAEMVVGG